jgi:hypothetical protein
MFLQPGEIFSVVVGFVLENPLFISRGLKKEVAEMESGGKIASSSKRLWRDSPPASSRSARRHSNAGGRGHASKYF